LPLEATSRMQKVLRRAGIFNKKTRPVVARQPPRFSA